MMETSSSAAVVPRCSKRSAAQISSGVRAYVPRTSSIARMCVGRRKTSVLTSVSAATSSPHSSQRSGRRDHRIGDAHTQISGAIRTSPIASPTHHTAQKTG